MNPVTATLGLVLLMATSAEPTYPEPAKLPAVKELPDPLKMFDGTPVKTAEDWNTRRKPELKTLIQHYMYGYFPEPQKITTKVVHEDRKHFDGKATLKLLTINYGPEGTPPINLLLVVPNNRKNPAPVFVGMNFTGNHTLLKDPAIPLPTMWMYPGRPGVKDNKATEESRGTAIDVWALEQSIDRGYAVATFYNGDVDPDTDKERKGIQPHFAKAKLDHPGAQNWSTICAWAYGIQRVVDYLVTDKDLDAKRIAVVGHSRLGKTALLAAAFDERIALAIPSQAGCGGTAPSRGTVGESVKKINTSFPHWFNTTFKEFNDATERIPFDQHCLVALCAPRPVLFPNAVEDSWANPGGQFEVLKAADPVYKLLKSEGVGAKEPLEPGKLLDSKLGYYIRSGKHSMMKEDWKVFLDYADKHLGSPK